MMKTKFFVIFAAFLFAAITAYNLQLAQTQNLGDISLADITVMAQADGETSPKVTRPLLESSSGKYYCGCTCTTSCGAICL